MLLQSLGYVGGETTRLDEWRVFGPRIMGLEVADATASSLAFRTTASSASWWTRAAPTAPSSRLGGRRRRRAGNGSPPGWTAGVRVEAIAGGGRPTPGGRGLCFLDPSGNRHEAFAIPRWRIAHSGPAAPCRAFAPVRWAWAMSCSWRNASKTFYVDVLEFRLSDYMLHPFKAYFFHTNARHHSLALAETGISRRLHHLMVETTAWTMSARPDLADADDCVSVWDAIATT